MCPRTARWIGVALALAGASPFARTAVAQELDRLAATAGEAIRLAYPAAGNVCGTGDGLLIREPDGSTMFVSGRTSRSTWQGWEHGEPPCVTGDVTLGMTRDGDRWSDIRIGIGVPGDFAAGASDLGYFTGQEAAGFLLRAARTAGSRAGRKLILAAAIARDAVVWRELLALARDRGLPTRLRQSALHWLGRRAAREAVEGLGGIVRDPTEEDRIREAAVFGLAQLPEDQAIPILVDIVRTMDDARVVNRALFWLADFDDPRAIGLFEEILAGG